MTCPFYKVFTASEDSTFYKSSYKVFTASEESTFYKSSTYRVARWLSSKCRTLAVAVLVYVAQTVELFTHALSGGITVIFIPDKEPQYRTVRLNTGHLATLYTVLYLNAICITSIT